MKPSLNNLPVEILVEILGQFCLHCRNEFHEPAGLDVSFQHENDVRPKQDPYEHSWYALDRDALFSISLSCRKLHRLAQDVLYHEFMLGYGDSVCSRVYNFEGRFASFMRAVGQRRDLAAEVRKVAIHPLLMENLSTKEIRDLLLESAGVLGIDLVQAWKRRIVEASTTELRQCHWFYGEFLRIFLTPGVENHRQVILDVWQLPLDFKIVESELIAILIALLPNVDHLSLWQDQQSKLHLCPSAFRALGITSLPKLKTLETEINSHPILALATGLETLNVREFLPHPNQDFDLPNLKTLRLARMTCKKENVLAIISRCTGGLGAFLYEQEAVEVTPDADDDYLTPSQAVEALKPHRKTLETLHLDFRCIYNTPPPDPAFFSFEDFCSLKRLLVSTAAIFYSPPANSYAQEKDRDRIWSRLPPSIVSLHLIEDEATKLEAIQEGLIGLADMKKSHPKMFPHLVQLHLGARDKLDEAVDRIMDAAGIVLTVGFLPTSSKRPIRAAPLLEL
ncbi:hypothetical protein CEP51_005568 [Fusarium floridanum]|uniref:Leucine-rich repeat domain-containing protein n=1 Tax=Fusarium floridanum TaxID=1325733 RepID=A0A428RWA8_9HYPO|nr:hypothetical protein CEP51_005568 [Fusarium floridanum]